MVTCGKSLVATAQMMRTENGTNCYSESFTTPCYTE